MNYRVGFGITGCAVAFTALVSGLILGLQALLGDTLGGALALVIVCLCLAFGISAAAAKL